VVLAAEGNHPECLKLLLKGGADKNASDHAGNRAVHRYFDHYELNHHQLVFVMIN